jgi:hypothetical protein
MGYRVVAMHVFGLRFCWFVDYSLVQRVTVLTPAAVMADRQQSFL